MKSTAILIDLVNNQNKCNTSLPSLYLIENIICYFRGSLNFLTPLVSIKVMAEHLEKDPPWSSINKGYLLHFYYFYANNNHGSARHPFEDGSHNV